MSSRVGAPVHCCPRTAPPPAQRMASRVARGRQSHSRNMSTNLSSPFMVDSSDDAPPLMDDSSDASSDEPGHVVFGSRARTVDERRDSCSTSFSDSFSAPDSGCDSDSCCEDHRDVWDSDGIFLASDRNHLEQAASFVLSRLQQRAGLESWDHADFVRMADQGLLYRKSWKPMVVLQGAQKRSFAFRGVKNTLMSKWRGRRRHGVVTGIKDLGIVRQIRDSRLIPFRLGCDCLYDHPVLSHLFNRDSANVYPRVMHINPLISGPVKLTNTYAGVPYCVAFAGAEFVVLNRRDIAGEEHWEVAVELFESIFVPTPKEEDGPSAPGLEGLPHAHSDRGTHRNVGLIACSAEGMQTLVEGQAPTDMDRFKAWHMDPRYHAVSHHVWSLEDARLFMQAHRFLLVTGPLIASFVWRMTLLWRLACLTYGMVVAWHWTILDEPLLSLYRSRASPVLMFFLKGCRSFFCCAFAILKIVDSVVRRLVKRAFAIHLLLPEFVRSFFFAGIKLVSRVVECILALIVGFYSVVVDTLGPITGLPDVPWLAKVFEFADTAIIGVCILIACLVLRGLALCAWWFHLEDPSPLEEMQEQHRQLMNRRDVRSAADFLRFVKKLVFEERSRDERAQGRRNCALGRGAPVCTGERAREPHACHAALAVAAVRLEPPRNVSASEKTAINRILVKSGIIRDSLVRTARVMLTTAGPVRAVEEIAHELMHAAELGITWPDEHFIGRALKLEGRHPTVENVSWHRAKWVAVAARTIVDREVLPFHARFSWLEAMDSSLPSEPDDDFDYRDCNVPPVERCVGCFAQSLHNNRRSGGMQHMKLEGGGNQQPRDMSGLSACNSAFVRPSGRRHARLHFIFPPDGACRVPPASLTCRVPEFQEFPFYHLPGQQLLLDRNHSKLLNTRIANIRETSARLARADEQLERRRNLRIAESAEATPSGGPQEQHQRRSRGTLVTSSSSSFQSEHQKNERKRRRAKARKERASEAEEARQQRLRELQDILENERDDGHGSESGGTNPIDPIDPSEDKRVKKNRSAKRGKNRGNNRAGGLPSEKISSSRTTNIYESDSEEDEDEDEQTLCIVCMVEKRNACLVHGKTSHQVVCIPCGDRLMQAGADCPICTRPIDAVIQNFF